MRKPFEGIFGNTAELRMLEFLLPLEGIDFNITELAEEVGISRPTAQKIVRKFLEYGILKITRERGGVRYYEINPKSPFVQLINEINNVLIAKMVGPEVMREVELYWERRTIEELQRLIVNIEKEMIKRSLISETEELPIPRKPIEDMERIGPSPERAKGVYVTGRDVNVADDIGILGRSDLNAA